MRGYFIIYDVTLTSHDAVRVTPSFVTDAVMVASPTATLVTTPEDDTIATSSFDDSHVTGAPTGVTVAVIVCVLSGNIFSIDISNLIVGTVPLPDPSTKTMQFSAGSVNKRVST